jgi:uncharacterized membrane protein YvbJ
MYCSTCGQQIAEHLNYCNSCGARIEKNPLVISNSSSSQLAKPLAITVMMGFVGFIAVLKIVLDNPRLDIPAIVLIVIAYLAALTIISAMMIGHMWKTAGDIQVHAKKSKIDNDEYAPPGSFRGSNTNQLGEPVHQPIGSVTDNTTRTLDEVLVERR